MGFFGLYGSTAALATTRTFATVENCIGIGFRCGTHIRWQVAEQQFIADLPASTRSPSPRQYMNNGRRRRSPLTTAQGPIRRPIAESAFSPNITLIFMETVYGFRSETAGALLKLDPFREVMSWNIERSED